MLFEKTATYVAISYVQYFNEITQIFKRIVAKIRDYIFSREMFKRFKFKFLTLQTASWLLCNLKLYCRSTYGASDASDLAAKFCSIVITENKNSWFTNNKTVNTQCSVLVRRVLLQRVRKQLQKVNYVLYNHLQQTGKLHVFFTCWTCLKDTPKQ